MPSKLDSLNRWVDDVAKRTKPDHIHWCDGSEAEYRQLVDGMLKTGDLIELNPQTHPRCYLHRSDPKDVARVEKLTVICTKDKDDAGPNNNWIDPAEAHARIDALFEGCMQGRTMYVIPYCMGPLGSPLARCGVEITDSPYVVANMRLMTRMGTAALERIEREGSFIKALHSIGELDPERRWIMHFPEELSIKSFGSGYGGNALLGKKCHALRIGSYQARSEGWLAEHMLIPPEGYRREGWKVWTVGDDICWMRPGKDGRLYAINPEAGYFGVAPGTSQKTNPNALSMLQHDTIFTNVAVTEDNQPWWEGLDDRKPVKDWQGRDYDPANGPAAHPNSRFTVRANQCPSWSPEAENDEGVPIDAIVFGGRRAARVPLVFEARNWTHGVLVGASMASETTAAATDVGVNIRRDPMAMKPFCGYNYGDYFAHWLSFDQPGAKLPRVFHVNWFRKDKDGKFLWPGFGDNMRVLEWMLKRVTGEAGAAETPIGNLPRTDDLNLEGLNLADGALDELFRVDNADWREEEAAIGEYLAGYGSHLPGKLKAEQQRVADALDAAAEPAAAPVRKAAAAS